MHTRWIESDGGPLILLPFRDFQSGKGVPLNDGSGLGGDYGRAVAVHSWVEKIVVAGTEALVFGGEPLPVKLIRRSSGHLFIVRWMHAEDGREPLEKEIEGGEPCLESLVFTHRGGELRLFDAAAAAVQAQDYLSADLTSGTYEVLTRHVQPDEHTHWIVHEVQLRRQ